MDINILREVVMVAALALFGGIVWWAYAPSRKQRFERDARSVLADEECDRATRAELLGAARAQGGLTWPISPASSGASISRSSRS